MIAAMMVLSATSAFAGDSDALKAVLKAKTYADAKALVEQNLGSMANDAEKAKADAAKALQTAQDCASKSENDAQRAEAAAKRAEAAAKKAEKAFELHQRK